MGLTNFPNGLTSFGVPILGAGAVVTTGNVFFVDSGVGVDGISGGSSPSSPFATIDYAVGRCTANNGDFIVAMPGHAETVSAAGGLALDVAGITVLGLGSGSDIPTVTLDAAAADVDVDAASVTIENVKFVSAAEDVAVCIDVNADWCTIRKCHFVESAADRNFLICVLAGTANQSDHLVVEDCHAVCDDASNTHFVSFPNAQDACIVRNNILMGDWTTATIGAASAVTLTAILNNIIFNTDNAADNCINMHASSTGFVGGNLVSNAHASQKITATAMGIAENYASVNADDESGILEPVAT
jgi:hypothetical protein